MFDAFFLFESTKKQTYRDHQARDRWKSERDASNTLDLFKTVTTTWPFLTSTYHPDIESPTPRAVPTDGRSRTVQKLLLIDLLTMGDTLLVQNCNRETKEHIKASSTHFFNPPFLHTRAQSYTVHLTIHSAISRYEKIC